MIAADRASVDRPRTNWPRAIGIAGVALATVVVGATVTACGSAARRGGTAAVQQPPTTEAAGSAPTVVTPPTTAPAESSLPAYAPAADHPPAATPVAAWPDPPALPLAGCPPPPYNPPPSTAKPWRPPVLVPESALPAAPSPAAMAPDVTALYGKGMWIWQVKRTEGGDPAAVVRRAVASGLSQLWVRVGDSQDGFYAAAYLEQLVPLAHAAHLSVIGWGFPYLWDPVGDAAWTAAAYQWQAPSGDRLDGFSADIEAATEGTALSARRASVYLGLVRAGAPGRVLVATVYRPNDYRWASYPYRAMAPYVDAFAPMVYWGCDQLGPETIQAIARLSTLRPVHVIGQAYNMASEGGRNQPPSGAEIAQFLGLAWTRGALGASFWDWQEMDTEEWTALGAYGWGRPVGRLR